VTVLKRTVGLFVIGTALFVATSVCAADTTPGGFSFFGSLIQMFAALAFVIGIILLMYYAVNKWLPRLSPAGGISRYIRVLETRYLAPKQALVLVEVGGEYLLVGSSPEGVTLIKQINMLEEIEVIEEPLVKLWQNPTADRFRSVLSGVMKSKNASTLHKGAVKQP
jgi:flagellar protein FliO/FliZ